MKKLLLISMAIGLSFYFSFSQEAYFMSHPSLSPDGKYIVFSFEGDLWQADLVTGDAYRLTAMQGYETAAKFSPDGKWLAFTGTEFGNSDVFMIPSGGGEIQQMTFHSAGDEMEGWTWDSKELLIRSSRNNSASVYKIPVGGGNPIRIFDHYFNVIHNVAIHPVSGDIFFNDTWESLSMTARKRYLGEYDPDIQSYNPKTGIYKKYTEWEGKDFWTTIDKNGEVYFVSDQNTGQYNLFKLVNENPEALTKFKTSIYRPSVSANGKWIVFEKDYQLWKYNTSSGKAEEQKITIIRNSLLPKDQSFKITSNISNFDVSPDNKKLAFVSRGALFVSDIKGKFVRELKPEKVFERVQEVSWLKDNKTLIISMTWNGYSNWFTIPADGSEGAKQITKDFRNNRNMVMNGDKSMAAYLSGRDELRIIDLEKFKTTYSLKDEFWGFQSGSIDFAPDDNWLLYTAKREFENDVFVLNIKTHESLNITSTGVSESGAKWSPDAKYIYLTTNRLRPSFPRGAGDVNLYRVALDNYDKGFRSEEFDKLFKGDSLGKGIGNKGKGKGEVKEKEEEVKVVIDLDRIWERYERISPGFGSQGGATFVDSKDGTLVLYASNHDKGKWSLWKTTIQDFESSKTELISGIGGRASLIVNKKKVYALSGGNIYDVNVASKKAKKISISYSFTRTLSEEFFQMFNQTWANLEENFYHEDMHGEDWEKHKKYYAQFVSHVNNRGDYRILMNDMLGELNSSHMGFNTRGSEEKSRLNYTTLECGLEYSDDNPYEVKRVVPRGAADHARVNILHGDKLIAVNEVIVDKSVPRDKYFYMPAMVSEIKLSFSRNNKEFDVLLHPKSARSLPGNYYDEWIDMNDERVKELSKGKIAYAHMKNMGSGELNKFMMTMGRELQGKKGLILDLRYNTGGNVHDDVLRFLQQRTYLHWKSREGKLSHQSNFAPSDYPIVMLINEQSLSDAEMTSAGFKELEMGTLVGTETYRWIIFTSSMSLVDGSSHRMPGWGCYTLDGVNLERSGVKPDVFIEQTFTDRLEGKDAQIEKAVEIIFLSDKQKR